MHSHFHPHVSRWETNQLPNWFYYKMQDVCINWTQLVPEKDRFKKRESTIHLEQGLDSHSKKGFKWNFILENKNIGTIETKLYGGKKLFYLTFNQLCLRCFYQQSLRMNKVWATVRFLDYFSFMFHPWLLFGFHRIIIKMFLHFCRNSPGLYQFPQGPLLIICFYCEP